MFTELILRLQENGMLANTLERRTQPIGNGQHNSRSICQYKPIDAQYQENDTLEIFLAPIPEKSPKIDLNILATKICSFLKDEKIKMCRIKFHFAFQITDENIQALHLALKNEDITSSQTAIVFYNQPVARRESHNGTNSYCTYVQHQTPYVLVKESKGNSKIPPLAGKHYQLMINGEILSEDNHNERKWCETLFWLVRRKQFDWSSEKQHSKYQALKQLGDQVEETLNNMLFPGDLPISEHIQNQAEHLFTLIGKLLLVAESDRDPSLAEIANPQSKDHSLKAKALHTRGDGLHRLGMKSQFTIQLMTHLKKGARFFQTADFVMCLEKLKASLEHSKTNWETAADQQETSTQKINRLEKIIEEIDKIITEVKSESDEKCVERKDIIAPDVIPKANALFLAKEENEILTKKRHPLLFWQTPSCLRALREAEEEIQSLTTPSAPAA